MMRGGEADRIIDQAGQHLLGGTMKRGLIAFLGALFVLGAGVAFAHHSFAMFDRDKEMTLVGVVEDFQWTNPHSWIEVNVPKENGAIDKWSIECNSPNNLSRQGRSEEHTSELQSP